MSRTGPIIYQKMLIDKRAKMQGSGAGNKIDFEI